LIKTKNKHQANVIYLYANGFGLYKSKRDIQII